MKLETSNKQEKGGSPFSSPFKGKTSVTTQATRIMDEILVAAKRQARWDPIPITYTKLSPKLIDNGFIMPVRLVPLRPPLSRWYNDNV